MNELKKRTPYILGKHYEKKKRKEKEKEEKRKEKMLSHWKRQKYAIDGVRAIKPQSTTI